MIPTFELVTAAKDLALGSSYLKLSVRYADELSAVKKDYPVGLLEDLELTDRESAKAVVFPQGYDQAEVLLFFRRGISTFPLFDALRKGLTLDFKRTQRVHLALSSLDAADAERVIEGVGNLLELAPYEPRKFGKKAAKPKGPVRAKRTALRVSIESVIPSADARLVLEHGAAQGRATNQARELAELPGNELNPRTYRAHVQKLAKDWDVEYKFLDQKALERRGANAFLAVVRATPDGENGIVHLIYRPKKGKASGRRLALVGKGLCFDTGGYNIKVGDGMLEMNQDMTGSAVALSLLGHLAAQNSPDEIHCFLALAENLISPTAYRPNDVVIASNGLSIEVVDTDAEGRMVLSDTLVYACEQKPDLLIDFATLTGAVIRAIGTMRCGVFTNHEPLRAIALAAGESTGERVWSFPIGEDYWDALHSEIADLRQCSSNNFCDHIYAATFLSAFVTPETPWLHIDLAAGANKGGLGLSTKDVTGWGIRFTEAFISASAQITPVKKKVKK